MADSLIIPPGAKAIPLSGGYYCIIDIDDFKKISGFSWHTYTKPNCPRLKYAVANTPYKRNEKRTTVKMHRIIMSAPLGVLVDHINGNGLDNRKCNLRLCSNAENKRNQPKRVGTKYKYKGVSYSKPNKKWEASIKVNQKRIYLGLHATEIAAAQAYDEAAIKHFGEFALLNLLSQD